MGGFRTAASATAVYCSTKKKLFGPSDAGEGKKGGKKRKVNDTDGISAAENMTTNTKGSIKAEESPEADEKASKVPRKRAQNSKGTVQWMGDSRLSTDNDIDHTSTFIKPEPLDETSSIDLLASAAQFLENEQAESDGES